MSDDVLQASFRGASLDRIEQGEGIAKLSCTLSCGERITIHLEGVMLIRSQGERGTKRDRNFISGVHIARGREVRGLARAAFAPHGGTDQPWLKSVAKRALLGQLCFFRLTPRIGTAVASLCGKIVILPTEEKALVAEKAA